MSITYCGCVFVLLSFLYAMRMRHIVDLWPLRLYSVSPHYLINGTIFVKKVIQHRVSVLFLYNFCLKYFSFWEELSGIWQKMYIGLHVKYRLFLSDSNEIWIFWPDFRKILKYKILWKSFQWEPSCSVRIDGTKLIFDFRNFCERV